MAASFLRKIILEELRKVLKEIDYPDIPGSQPGEIESRMSSESDPFADIPGAEPGQTMTPSGIAQSKCGPGFDSKCQPKYLKLQKELNRFARASKSPKIKEDGIPGKETNNLFEKATGRPLKYANLKDPLSFKETMISLRDYTNNLISGAAVKSKPSEPDKKEIRKKLAKTTIAGALVDPETGEDVKIFPEKEKTLPESLIRKEINKLLKQI